MSEESIFYQAFEIADPVQRSAFLDHACSGNAELRQELDQLLTAAARNNPLDHPAVNLEPTNLFESEPESRPAEVGDHIGPYRLMEQIGEGGFGLVFVAEQQRPVARKVAIKILKPGMDTRDIVARFEAERQALALMDHPHIAKVLDAGSTDSGRPYFVMELVRGVPITEYCDQQKLSTQERLKLFMQVCHAIQHAHQKGVIHRDIKPNNVLVTMIDGVGVPKVIDFGVAKAIGQKLTEKTLYTKFAQMVGTPLYMSPEQAQMSGVDVDTRTDIYALGVLLYELLTGTTPFDRERFRRAAFDEIRRIIREEDPPRPSTRLTSLGETLSSVSINRGVEPSRLPGLVRGEIDWIVMKSLEKDRNRRYETANGLARDVQRFLNQEAVEACPPTFLYRIGKTLRKHKAPILTSAAFVALLLIALSVTTYQALTNQSLAKKAQRYAQQAESNAYSAQENAKIARIERENAKAEAAATRAVSDFLFEDLIAPLDPSEQSNRQITLMEVIENASRRLDGRFSEARHIEANIKLRLGQLYHSLREIRTSRQMLLEAYQIRRELFGPDDDQTMEALEVILVKGGSVAGPKTKLAKTLFAQRTKRFGDEHPATLRAHRILIASQLQELEKSQDPSKGPDRWSEFERKLNLIVNKQRQILGDHHQEVIETLKVLGSQVYEPQGKVQDALDNYRQCLESARHRFGGPNWQSYDARLRICGVLAAAQRFKELESEARNAIIERKSAPNQAQRDSRPYDFLMISYIGRGRVAEGLEMYEEFSRSNGGHQAGRLAEAYAKYGDRETYARQVANQLIQFEHSEDFGELRAAANNYLLVPSQNPELLGKAVKMARKAMAIHPQGSKFYWYILVRGMAEYRVGELHEAKRLLSDRRIAGANTSYPTSRAYLAMTEFKLGNIEKANSLLEESKVLISAMPSKYPQHYAWSSIIRAQLALEEAIELIEGETSAKKAPKS